MPSTASAGSLKATCARWRWRWPNLCLTKAMSRRLRFACSTLIFMRAWWALWPRASKTNCTAPHLFLPPAAPLAKSTNSKVQAARLPVFICATRSIWSPNAHRACCCVLADTPWLPAARLPRNIWTCLKKRSTKWHWNGWTRPPCNGDWKPMGRCLPNTAEWIWWRCCNTRCGAKVLHLPCSAKKSRWYRSGWWAKNTCH